MSRQCHRLTICFLSEECNFSLGLKKHFIFVRNMLAPNVTFLSLMSGPIWNFSKMGDNVRTRLVRMKVEFFFIVLMSYLSFQTTIREALGLAITADYRDSTEAELQRSEQDLINKDRSEIDLLCVWSKNSQRGAFQAETKSNTQDTGCEVLKKDIKKAVKQLEHFKSYLERMHGPEVQNFWYLPAVALPNIPRSLLLQRFPNHPFCTCNGGMPVAEIEITESHLEPPGDSLDMVYHGQKYQVCEIRILGRGCSFFKWASPQWASPQSSSDPDRVTCDCCLVPITVKIPLREAKKSKKKARQESKMFQVCRKRGCNFFRWCDQNPISCQSVTREQKFADFCSKHFLLSDHLTSQQEQTVWWEENTREHHENIAVDISDSIERLSIITGSLTMRLLTVASMAFTQIPRLISRDAPDSILVLMR